ncbi:MAG: hypothetical protein HOW59_25315, partial [Nonomuraea sp.]|nr:hypothetical protein [Nonomuraea sp.]
MAAGGAGIAPAAPAEPAPFVTLTGPQVKQVQEKRVPKPAWKIALDYAMDKRGTPYV